MNSQPLASVIITNYQYGRYLADAIDSVLQQTWPNVEVIVVDDGSTDDSLQVIASYGDRITAVLKPNGGQGSAFNAGFSASQGEVIFFLDADDVFVPAAVATVMPKLLESNIAMVHWYGYRFTNKGLTNKIWPYHELCSGNALPILVEYGPLSFNSAGTLTAYRRWWVEQVMPMPAPGFLHSADAYLFTLAPIFGEMVALADKLTHYRMTPASMSKGETVAGQLRLWYALEDALASNLQSHLDIEIDRSQWRRKNRHFPHWHALQMLETELEQVLPDSAKVALFPTDVWKPALFNGVRKYRTVRFAKHDPVRERLDTVESLHEEDIEYLVFDGPAFEPLVRHQRMAHLLEQQYETIFANERATVFRFTEKVDMNGAQADVPLASIVINNFNYGRYLGAAIDSALEQTWPNVEVIVVDDGSTDCSRDVIASYGDRIVPLLKENGGQGSGFNAGFGLSRGDVIFFLDADDLYLPHAVATVMPTFADPGVAKAQWFMHQFDEAGMNGKYVQFKLQGGDVLPLLMELGPFGYQSAPTSGCAFSRRVVLQTLPMQENEFRVGADSFLNTVAPVFGNVATLQDTLSFYRITPGSLSTQLTVQQALERWNTLEGLLEQQIQKQLLLDVSPSSWRSNSPIFRKWYEMQQLELDIEQVLPLQASIAYLPSDNWRIPIFNRVRDVPTRQFSPKVKSQVRLHEAERLFDEGSEYLVVESIAFDPEVPHQEVIDSLRKRHTVEFENERVVVFRNTSGVA